LEIGTIRSQKHESDELRDILFRGVRRFEWLLMLQPRAFIKLIQSRMGDYYSDITCCRGGGRVLKGKCNHAVGGKGWDKSNPQKGAGDPGRLPRAG
jgi:hypothetical protein